MYLETLLRPDLTNWAQRAGILGQVFYVNGNTGNNGNSGHDPNYPLETITYALSLCVSGRNDYIIVQDCWQEAMPIVVNKESVHIIGISLTPGRPWPCLNAAADTAIFQMDPVGDMAEIAGFCMGGGASHGAIEVVAGVPYGVYIHDNVFGHPDSGNTPLAGILAANGGRTWRIERNKILGDGGNVGGVITGNGLQMGGASLATDIIENVIMGVDICIILAGFVGGHIYKNHLAPNADAAAAGITLGAGCVGSLIEDNECNFGDAAMVANPYLENGGAGADNNHWAGNKRAGTVLAPA